MRVLKRLFESRAVLAAVGPLMRLCRWMGFAGTLPRHDPALRALLRSRQPAIFAVWHQDFLHTSGYLSHWNPHRPTQVLASASRDGELMAAAAEGVGFRGAVRGSSARGGAPALRALARLASAGGTSILVVCDGPRPPARVLQPGALHVASASGLPLWLVRTSWRPTKVLERTWARFLLPSPFARVVVLADGPIHVPPDLERDELERLRASVEARLNALADRADAQVAAR